MYWPQKRAPFELLLHLFTTIPLKFVSQWRITFNRRPLAKLDQERNFSHLMAPSRLRTHRIIVHFQPLRSRMTPNFKIWVFVNPRIMSMKYQFLCNARYLNKFKPQEMNFCERKLHTDIFASALDSVCAPRD